MAQRTSLACVALVITGCQMANPAFDRDELGDGDTTLNMGDGDGDAGDGDAGDGDAGDGDAGDGDGEATGGGCGDGHVDPGEECDGSPVPNGECGVDCTILCEPPFEDCNGAASDGCEVNLDEDELNCGQCGSDCLGAGCELGLCGAFLIAEASLPYDVAIAGGDNDGGTVYWTDRGADTVSRKPLEGQVELVASGLDQPMKIALGPDRVFFTEWGAGRISGWSFDLTDVWIQQGQPAAWAVAVGGTEVFWGLRDQGLASRMSQDGPGVGEKLFDGQPALTGLAYASEFVAFISGAQSGTVGVVWFGDGALQILATGVGVNLNEVDTDGAYVYFTNGGQGTVEKIAVEGGQAEVLAAGQAGPYGIVVRGDWVFWGNGEGGQVMALQLGDDQPIVRADGQTKVRGMDANGRFLVWARNHLDGSVWGVAL